MEINKFIEFYRTNPNFDGEFELCDCDEAGEEWKSHIAWTQDKLILHFYPDEISNKIMMLRVEQI